MADPRRRITLVGAITDVGAQIDFGQVIGSFVILNLGPNDVALSDDGTIPAGGSAANGRTIIPANQPYQQFDSSDSIFGLRCAAGETATVQITGTLG